MKSEICKDKIYTVKEGVTPQMISDLRPELLEREDVREEEEEDPLVEEDGDHQVDHQRDHQVDRLEEIIIIEIGTISKATTRAVT